eukprot:COSAG01_NODE_14686_length_1422_cov_0.969766_1_plen_56_part_10
MTQHDFALSRIGLYNWPAHVVRISNFRATHFGVPLAIERALLLLHTRSHACKEPRV